MIRNKTIKKAGFANSSQPVNQWGMRSGAESERTINRPKVIQWTSQDNFLIFTTLNEIMEILKRIEAKIK